MSARDGGRYRQVAAADSVVLYATANDVEGPLLMGCIMIVMRILDYVHDLRSEDVRRPVYQVTFWGRSTAVPDRPEHESPYESEFVQVGDADVAEVLAWAAANAGDRRTYQVEVATSDHDTVSNLILLYGSSPVPDTPQGPPEWFDAGPNAINLR
jgi:hypothetical protein